MTDPSGIKPTTGMPAAQGAAKGQVVQIVSLPEGLENNARGIRLQGEVLQQNNDGTTRVRTPQGDIDINVRGRQPQAGQKIEVDIPPGSPPRQATIRPAPAQAPPPQQPAPPPTTTTTAPPQTPLPQPPPTQGQAPAQPPPQPPVTGGTTQPLPAPPSTSQAAQPAVTTTAPQPVAEKPPLPGTYQPPLQGTAPTPPPVAQLPSLAPGQVVKLVPLIPMQSGMPQIDSPEISTIAKTDMKATVIAQKSQGNLITTLLQAVKSVMPDLLNPQASGMTKPALSGSPATASMTAPTIQNILAPQNLSLSAKILSLTLPSGQTLSMPPVTISPTPVPTTGTTSAITLTVQTPSTITPPLLTVTVTQVTPQNQPIIPIPINDSGAVQNFVLQFPPATVPTGTQITLQPQLIPSSTTQVMVDGTTITPTMPAAPGAPSVIAAPASALPPAWRAMLPLMQPASMWPVLDEMFQTFYQATPQAAQIMGRTIPSPANGANFGPAVMLFAAAIKSGDLQAWMGDKKLEMIQKLGKGSLLSRLSAETSSLAGNTDTAATDWKSFPIPLLWQNEISKIMFHVRKEPNENEQDNANDGTTRFIMDLSLTRMGEVQLDGMVRGKQLDLIVRTQIPISAHMQESMRLAYAKALDNTDIFGDIGFQSDVTNWENVLKRGDKLGASVQVSSSSLRRNPSIPISSISRVSLSSATFLSAFSRSR